MSILNFLKLQPVEPKDDGTTSDLDTFAQDETIDLTHDITEQDLESFIETIEADQDKLNFSEK